MCRLLLLFFAGCISAKSQTITEIFGSDSNSFSIDFVLIQNTNNSPMTGVDGFGSPFSAGAVSYLYCIGKYEISREIISKANLAGELGIGFLSAGSGGTTSNKPATLTWVSAAKFVNYLNTSRGYLPAYKFDSAGNFQLWSSSDIGYQQGNPFRNSFAKYWLPSADEWFKSAYGTPTGTWFNFATGSDSGPDPIIQGTGTNTAVYAGVASGPADVSNAGGLSPWGTMAQLGNVIEWLETAMDLTNDLPTESRLTAGGTWTTGSNNVGSRARDIFNLGQGPDVKNISASWAPTIRISMNPAPTHYVLVINQEIAKGNVTTSPQGLMHSNGTIVSLNAFSAIGYIFDSWSGDFTGSNSATSINMNSNKTITANYIPDNSDNDGDGLSNYQEAIIFNTNPNRPESNSPVSGLYLASQFQSNRESGRNEILASPNSYGLFYSNQMLDLKLGGMVIGKTNNQLVLTYQINQSTNLTNWTVYREESMVLSNAPADKMFLRLNPKQ